MSAALLFITGCRSLPGCSSAVRALILTFVSWILNLFCVSSLKTFHYTSLRTKTKKRSKGRHSDVYLRGTTVVWYVSVCGPRQTKMFESQCECLNSKLKLTDCRRCGWHVHCAADGLNDTTHCLCM